MSQMVISPMSCTEKDGCINAAYDSTFTQIDPLAAASLNRNAAFVIFFCHCCLIFQLYKAGRRVKLDIL